MCSVSIIPDLSILTVLDERYILLFHLSWVQMFSSLLFQSSVGVLYHEKRYSNIRNYVNESIYGLFYSTDLQDLEHRIVNDYMFIV
jgi:hypothetical protein